MLAIISPLTSQQGRECYCDNYMKPTAVQSNGCDYVCAGTLSNPSGPLELCGGAQRINVYNNTDPAFTPTGSNANSAGGSSVPQPSFSQPANYIGCASDLLNNAGRALRGASMTSANMTAAVCKAFCSSANKGNGYQFYGTEYKNECFCGNTISQGNMMLSATSTPSNSTCKMQCGGSSTEICGGAGALSLYNNTAYSAPQVNSPIAKYVAQQCLTEGSGGRALQGASYANNNMTQETCVAFCGAKSMQYAGVEYAR